MNYSIKLFIGLSIILSLFSCKKNQVGGKGSVTGNVAHHGKAIADAYVYIKFNTSEFPGDDYTKYDTYVQTDANGNYTIPFYKGNYYLFAKGYDLEIAYPFIVKGGTSFSLKNKQKTTIDIAVSED